MQNREQSNYAWFLFYTKEIENRPPNGYKKFDKYFLCPCCYFPTLTTRGSFDICMLCDWEDDGQDDHNADIVLGGPNQDYSLTEVRENFKLHLTSYRPSDVSQFERATIRKTFDNKTIFDPTEIKNQIIEKYNSIMRSANPVDTAEVFLDIERLSSKLLSDRNL